MKLKVLFTAVFAIIGIASYSQTQYEVSPDPNHPEQKILRGIITSDLLKSDTAYKWYASSEKSYNPADTSIVGAIKRNSNVNYIVFGGTWCEDTQFILPKFFNLQAKAGTASDRITLFGVNREKKTIGNLAAAMNIINVPTIIVMKNGKEVGRVVEYGTTGKWDKELSDIVSKN
jgi:thiol-disulfide isomerase/thioredoxin